ncbi:MAG: hypothetical protein WBZ36_05545 [Candidatus Nitrosopolaris sp.]
MANREVSIYKGLKSLDICVSTDGLQDVKNGRLRQMKSLMSCLIEKMKASHVSRSSGNKTEPNF